MRILYYNAGGDPALWLSHLGAALPEADIREWKVGDHAPADYALVWKPPEAMLSGRTGLKAIFNLAAGVDALLDMRHILPAGVPVFRLEDAGMAVQMAEYVTCAVLRYFRHFDEYAGFASCQKWLALEPERKSDFQIGIMGMGVMGKRVAQALMHFGLPVKGWSRTPRQINGMTCFTGDAELDAFLNETKVLICLLPLTSQTSGILNRHVFSRLKPGAFLINAARGAHLIESDLADALDSGLIRAATLDVARTEPLIPSHPFWKDPRITITPHIAAVTLYDEAITQIAGKLRAFEKGETINGMVDMARGY